LFSWYTANFGNYDETYGSLGALIAFLFWVWISVNAVIVGAELNSELERQTAKDSTVGGDEPLGQRDARVADTLGRSTQEETDDDPRAGKDPEWVAGFEEGRKYAKGNHKPLPLRYAVPAALAVTLMGRKKGE
jgi:membrane protein